MSLQDLLFCNRFELFNRDYARYIRTLSVSICQKDCELHKDYANVRYSFACIDENTACVIRSISKTMVELSIQAIKNKKYELTATYFHPILSSILSNPKKRAILRWTNIESGASGNKRPDATLTEIERTGANWLSSLLQCQNSRNNGK
ncbi:hypothetical protein HPULCUR_010389 [Helicostylum pulchrum]|uniref:Uncharacterized protein n=1 Tax=Helicostylum pulchrum TaxID=562976 RepID=A0ABP9YDI7_9FUNG